MTRLRTALAGLLAAFAVLAPAGAASAHDALSRSDPKNDAEVAQAPEQVTLTYTAPVLRLGSTVRVLDPAGENVAVGRPRFTDREVVQPLRPGLAKGKYRIEWQVTSSDGHPIAGRLAFTVTEGAAAPTAAPTTAVPEATTPAAEPGTAEPTAVSPASSENADEGSSWASPATFALIAVVLVAVVVGAAVLARRGPSS